MGLWDIIHSARVHNTNVHFLNGIISTNHEALCREKAIKDSLVRQLTSLNMFRMVYCYGYKYCVV